MTARPGFYGYRRSDGRVGTRNHVLVVPTVICSSLVAERVAAAAPPLGVALPHLAGCGQLGPDMRVTHDTLAAYCGHPNVGAVLVARARLRTGRRAGTRRRGTARTASRSTSSRFSREGGHHPRDREGAVRIAQDFAADARAPTPRVVRRLGRWCCRSSAADRTTPPAWRRTRRSAASPTGSSISAARAVLGEIAEIMGAEHLLAARATPCRIRRRS